MTDTTAIDATAAKIEKTLAPLASGKQQPTLEERKKNLTALWEKVRDVDGQIQGLAKDRADLMKDIRGETSKITTLEAGGKIRS